MTAFYNERDPYAAEWLRNLIAAGHIAPGIVSEDDIRDLKPDDLAGFTQCHFFAGIGVWSHALRKAGWPDDEPIWTGSCPCQPFSAAGRRAGVADERHLWPHWFWLIDQCRPPIVTGEQVASKDGLGWLDLVSADMEGSGYAFGASDLCAAGFGGAHIRQRLYFVGLADADSGERYGVTNGEGCQRDREATGRIEGDGQHQLCRATGGLADALPAGRPERGAVAGSGSLAGCGELGGLGNTDDARPQGRAGVPERADQCAPRASGVVGGTGAPLLGRHPADWLFCRDGKWRPVEPGTFPLAHAAPARVGRLRAYGNALDAETAEEFIGAVIHITGRDLIW